MLRALPDSRYPVDLDAPSVRKPAAGLKAKTIGFVVFNYQLERRQCERRIPATLWLIANATRLIDGSASFELAEREGFEQQVL